MFIKYENLSLSRIKFYLYQKFNFIFIKNQILSFSKLKIYLYRKLITFYQK